MDDTTASFGYHGRLVCLTQRPPSTTTQLDNTNQVVTPEFGTSRDPLKALTSLPKAPFRWARRRRFPRQNRGWTPVEQTEQDEDGDEEAASAGGPAAARVGEPPPPGAAGGVGGDPADFEPLEEEEEEGGAGVRRGVVIKGLRKEFGPKVAVAGLDLHLRVGDITCLLGHNGAGESVVVCRCRCRCCYRLVGTKPLGCLSARYRRKHLLP